MSERSYYDVLGVDRTADQAAVKAAFRRKAKETHPDTGGCENTFKELNEAYAVLSDPEKRALYDRFGKAAFGSGGGPHGGHGQADFSDIFSEVFGEAFGDIFSRGAGGGRRGGPERGQDLRYDMEITLEEAFLGAEREISVPSAQNCGTCRGSGAAEGSRPETCMHCGGAGQVRANQGMFRMVRTCPSCGGRGQVIRNPCRTCAGRGRVQQQRTLAVKIPAGVEDGTRIRLAGEGNQGAGAAHNGDLYIFLAVKAHPLFERDGADLYCRAVVPMVTAALGGAVEIPTIDGGPSTITVPEGSQTGRRIRLKNKGMTTLRGGPRGDLHVELFVETPQKLTAKQRKLLEEFAETCGEDAHPQSKGFFDAMKRFFDTHTETHRSESQNRETQRS